MKDKLVSICIPAYQNPMCLERLIKSILSQNYKDVEIIITDDSEDDSIKRIVKLYEEQVEIKYKRNQVRLGSARNCNEAMSMASGTFIKVMHHDDWFSSNVSLWEFVCLLENNPTVDIAFSGTNQVSIHTQFSRCITDDQISSLYKDYRNLFLGNFIGAPSATIIRNKKYLFDSKLKWLVDIDLYMQILEKNNSFVYTKYPLVSIGIGETQLTRACEKNYSLQFYEYKYLLCKYKLYKNPKFLNKLFGIIWMAIKYKIKIMIN